MVEPVGMVGKGKATVMKQVASIALYLTMVLCCASAASMARADDIIAPEDLPVVELGLCG
jgi:hypothetical protein